MSNVGSVGEGQDRSTGNADGRGIRRERGPASWAGT